MVTGVAVVGAEAVPQEEVLLQEQLPTGGGATQVVLMVKAPALELKPVT